MGSFTFKWEHDAEEAFVTGTFDNWRKSIRLEKKNGIFQRTVELDDTPDKIYYKFVVDHNWTINESAPHEADRDGNINNYLTPSDLAKSNLGVHVSPFISSVSPDSSTVEMAGKKNKQKKQASKQASATASSADLSPAPENVPAGSSAEREPSPTRAGPTATSQSNPMDATTATPTVGPGGFPGTPAEENKTIGINPLPAAVGGINPIKLSPGEKIPENVSGQGVNDNVKLDKESYERSDALPGVNTDTQLPPVSKNMIPESSLPMGNGADAQINSAAPAATSAGLAGAVPLESHVPDVVKQSQDKAGVAPEASAVPEEVREKAKVEEELKEKVDKAPVTAEGVGAAAATTATAAASDKLAPATTEASANNTDKLAPSATQASGASTEKLAPTATDASTNSGDKLAPAATEASAPSLDKQKTPEAPAASPAADKSADAEASKGAALDAPKSTQDNKADDTLTAKDSQVAPETKGTESEAVGSTPEATKPSESEAADAKPVDSKAETAKTQDATDSAAATNGSGSKAEATPEKKKRNRLSTMFTRIKEKLSDRK
ncbi:hypothetical protein HIM_08130 [Hirsutella minnesotensis 3608]|uniref:AMP-activated protein kinase glycogen-binding domain-containing protein n=1 Tax=Hirsutella minnesotensis 3608 TaxID=1043627 RepID=A0A0F7ZHD7_9HYPO|nr:hypothetical protein HIM_08130 [Hirsutella minnesotensis 3608]